MSHRLIDGFCYTSSPRKRDDLAWVLVVALTVDFETHFTMAATMAGAPAVRVTLALLR